MPIESDDLFQASSEPLPPIVRTRAEPISGIRDNHNRGTVADFLREKIAVGSDLSIVSAYFTIYAYDALSKELKGINGLRFLFGEPRFISSLDPEKTDKKSFQIEDNGIGLTNRLQQKQIAAECADWIEQKAVIRSVRKSQLLHGKLYHIQDGRVDSAILGSSNFTSAGIGESKRSNLELNIVVNDNRDRSDLKDWFDELWNDESLVEDVKDDVLRYLEQIYVDHAPEFIYFKTLYHLFEKFLKDKKEEDVRFKQLEITETEIWKTLFEFQRDGVKGAINKINAHNGCILADSVGLGKTFTALAVIKYCELRNDKVLVLCPKKLRDNWTVYKADNNSELNPFLKDAFRYTVLSHTDLSRDSGRVGDINLNQINWGGYDLIVIDESHNFRNNTKGKVDAEGNAIKKSRYERLMQDIIQKGVNTKVLLLSATPVNNDLKDLRNQIYFITAHDDSSFELSMSIPSVKDTLASAQRTFMAWAELEGEKDTKELLERLPAGFFTLLDELTIARSRKHLKRYYKESLAQIGEFPQRAKPRAIHCDIDLKKEFMSYDELSDQIDKYKLALFNPFEYVELQFRPLYLQKIGNFTQGNREKFLVAMMKVNFLKRLESSIQSFEITLDRTVKKIEDLEDRLRNFQAHKIKADSEVIQEQADGIELEDEDLAEAFEVGKALRYKMEHLDVDRWLSDLERDRKQLSLLHEQALSVTPERDEKLEELKKIISKKLKNPTTNKNGEPIDKIVVFTAFADTAKYLFENLMPWAKEQGGAHIAMVSGGAKPNETTFGTADYTQILTNFAPRAKNRSKMPSMPQNEEISILIATDCISEGQNLQDCDLLVNYDIHWNPVRIIQRFGRIDRIGSLHNSIHLVNFWPTPDLNKYINLKNRVEARMALADISATAEDNLLDPNQLEELVRDDLKYRDRQLMRLKEEILDLEDFRETPSLSEFSLDDFRMELANYIEANRKILEDAPLGLYTCVPVAETHLWLRPGIVFCLRQTGNTEGNETINPLQPYFLVYIHDTGDVRYSFSQPKQILDMLRDLCAGRSEAYKSLCELFDEETQNGQDMTRYSGLLIRAVQTIVEQFGKRGFDVLLSSRSGKLPEGNKTARGVENFELITWLVIKQEGSNNNANS